MADGMSIDWASSPGDMERRVESYKTRLLNAVYALASEWASRLASEMKANHVWQNRTGEAEAKLFGRVFRTAFGAVMILGHGAAHGIFLERRWGGKYAVVMPTIQQNLAAIMASLQRLVR